MLAFRRRALGAATLLTWLLCASPSWAGAPTEQLRAHIDRVVKTLQDAHLKEDGRAKERRAAIRRIAEDIFDFTETAKRSLGPHWQPRTPAERREFVALFSDLLERAYLSKIEVYNGERIAFLGEAIDGDQATVRTRIVTRQRTEVPVDYRLFRQGERWLVYDVVIEGVSLVANYRTQFNKIIQTSSYGELIQRMKSKQSEFLDQGARTSTTPRDRG